MIMYGVFEENWNYLKRKFRYQQNDIDIAYQWNYWTKQISWPLIQQYCYRNDQEPETVTMLV